jgi:hypothetical protein
MQQVVDVKKYLENDLNKTGVASVGDQIKQINESASSINKKLQNVVDELDQLAQRLMANKPPPPETPAAAAEKPK